MIEVFKTNVAHREHAEMLVEKIHKAFANYCANFDCDDCDHILRVECATENIRHEELILLLGNAGFHAEILPDEI